MFSRPVAVGCSVYRYLLLTNPISMTTMRADVLSPVSS